MFKLKLWWGSHMRHSVLFSFHTLELKLHLLTDPSWAL